MKVILSAICSAASEADRTIERAKLQAKKDRLETAISKARLPLNQLKPVPIPKFETELAAMKQAQFNLDVIVREIENFEFITSL